MKRVPNLWLECSCVPVVLSVTISLAMLVAARCSVHYWHRFLLWNLFLAVLPYLFSVWAVWLSERARDRAIQGKGRKFTWPVVVALGLWLLFFPNAPYPITDFIHMQFDPEPVWYDVAVLAAFAWTGLISAMVSLRLVQSLVRRQFGRVAGCCVVAMTLVLAGFGIYLGRIQRWNSWDVFTRPRLLAAQVARGLGRPFDHGRAFGTTAIFASLLLLCYVSLLTARPRIDARK